MKSVADHDQTLFRIEVTVWRLTDLRPAFLLRALERYWFAGGLFAKFLDMYQHELRLKSQVVNGISQGRKTCASSLPRPLISRPRSVLAEVVSDFPRMLDGHVCGRM